MSNIEDSADDPSVPEKGVKLEETTDRAPSPRRIGDKGWVGDERQLGGQGGSAGGRGENNTSWKWERGVRDGNDRTVC